jgi:Ser/Thr protein kinase RdoA (MazF antagonist)
MPINRVARIFPLIHRTRQAPAVDNQVERVLRLYPDDCQPHGIEPVGGGFSGARLWRLQTDRGRLCLRCWPVGHPSQERLKFIQAVLWHVDQEGFRRIPVPLGTRHGHGYVLHAGHLWELAPWLPGLADYGHKPSPDKLRNALRALAEFHCAAATFPLPDNGPVVSPGILERHERLAGLMGGRFDELRAATQGGPLAQLNHRGQQLIALAASAAPKVASTLELASAVQVELQPCIRDVWSAHVLFVGNEVRGIVDFGSMRPENVAADVARLLGSMAGDDAESRQAGLKAYEEVRHLSDAEHRLHIAFDQSTVLLGGLQWLEWIYVEGKVFSDYSTILSRMEEFIARLRKLA